jgi:iron complex outermembrane receptor protein
VALAQTTANPDTATASATPPPPVGDGEIVVTARQRGETLISVPVAVTAIGGDQLTKLGVTDARDLSKFSPSLLLDRGASGGGGVIGLRGVSTSPNLACRSAARVFSRKACSILLRSKF